MINTIKQTMIGSILPSTSLQNNHLTLDFSVEKNPYKTNVWKAWITPAQQASYLRALELLRDVGEMIIKYTPF